MSDVSALMGEIRLIGEEAIVIGPRGRTRGAELDGRIRMVGDLLACGGAEGWDN